MPRLIDADNFVKYLEEEIDIWRHPEALDWAIGKLKREPAIDAVHAAGGCYCGECIHYKPQKQSVHWNHEALYCRRTTTMKMSPTDYCSKGERRNDNV